MTYVFAETVSYSGHFEGAAAYAIVLIIGVALCLLLGLLILPALVIAGIARRQAERIRNERVTTVIAQYEPPHSLSPAEVGLLYDMRCRQTELMATLFDLEQRGIVRLVDSRTVEIIDQTTYDDLAEYEKIAIRIARGETGALDTPRTFPFNLTDSNDTVYQFNLPLPQRRSLRAFSHAVQQSLVARGIPMQSFTKVFFIRVIIVTILIGLLPLLIAAMPVEINGVTYGARSGEAFANALGMVFVMGFLFTPLYFASAMLFTWLWTKIAGRYWINTRAARALWPELEGYRLYLKQVDLDNIQFESTDRGGTPVTKTLPYAMVFGLDTRWEARLRTGKA